MSQTGSRFTTVRIFLSLVRALGWMVNDQGYGSSTPESLTSYDRDTQSWKTSERSLFEELTVFSGPWPKSGMLVNGKIYALPMSERRTEESEFGLLPTPTRMDYLPIRSEEALKRQYDKNRAGRTGHSTLRESVAYPPPKVMWPTPCASDYKGSGVNGDLRNRFDYAVERGATKTKTYWPTPGTTGLSNGSGNCEKINKIHAEGKISEEERRSMRPGNGGKLNPEFVEWLMGYPIGWTDLEHDNEKLNEPCSFDNEPDTPRVIEGTKSRANRLKCLGNSIVPEIAARIFIEIKKDMEK